MARARTRKQAAALAAVVVLWLMLVFWCVNLTMTVSRLRRDVDARITWLFEGERLRREGFRVLADAGRRANSHLKGLRFQFPRWMRDALTNETLWDAPSIPPEVRRDLRLASAEVVTTGGLLHDRIVSGPDGSPHRPLVQQFERYMDSLDVALSRALGNVRRDADARTARLDRKWSALYVLAALAIGLLGALGYLLWRWRREITESGLKGRYFSTLVQSARDLIWALDARGHWTFVNDAARRIYGYDPTEMLDRPFTEFTAPDHLQRDRMAFRRLMQGETVSEYETEHVRKDGSFVSLVYRATPMLDARGEVVGTMGTATDVTHTRKMQEQLLLNERLQAVATLGGGVAHDFNNLLTVIIGQAEVAKARGPLSAHVERRINSIHETAMRARKLTLQLIAFARRQPLQKEAIDLVAVVRQLGELSRQLAGEHVRVQEVLPNEEVRIVADWSQIEQVIINLVLNARDAMPERGTVTVSVQRRTLSADEAGPHGLSAGEWAVLEVSDDGEGIDPAIMGRIFDPFFTTKEPGKGTGLGLATVHGVVQQHDGTIVASTTHGAGTCMQVFLPLAQAGAAAPKSAGVAP